MAQPSWVSQPDWAQPGMAPYGAAHSKFMPAPKLAGWGGPQSPGPPGSGPGPYGSSPSFGSFAPPQTTPSWDTGSYGGSFPKTTAPSWQTGPMDNSGQFGGMPGALPPPPNGLGGSLLPPPPGPGLIGVAPPGLAGPSPQFTGLQQQEDDIMRQLNSLQSDLKGPLGSPMMPSATTPTAGIGGPMAQPMNTMPGQPNMFGGMQNQMQPPNNMQAPPGIMGGQPNFNTMQNPQQTNFNPQFSGIRPPTNMQPPSFMQQNNSPTNPLAQHMQQNPVTGRPNFQQPAPLASGIMALEKNARPNAPPPPGPRPGMPPGGPLNQASAKGALPPPPPSPPADGDGLTRTNSSGGNTTRSKDQGPAFGKRFMQLRKENPDIPVPPDMFTYSLQDLEDYFVSRGAKKGGISAEKAAEPEVAEVVPDNAKEAARASRKRKATGPPPADELQYSTEEALVLQGELIEGFGHRHFQEELKRIQARFPHRKTKGHKDMPAYFEAFETASLAVYSAVLPRHRLEANWDGVRSVLARMSDALKHPKVMKTQEEINVLMGLPRNAIFQPPKTTEELFTYHPACDAPVPGFSRPTVVDEDGDEAHEFFVEDPETGELRQKGPTALEDADCWYVVLHKPSIILRSRPSAKGEMVGRKKKGKKFRVQRVVDNKWVQLHASECVRLGVKEAWCPLDGETLGLPGQQLIERET